MKIAVKLHYVTITLHVLIWGMVLTLPYFISSSENGYKISPIPGLFFSLAGCLHLFIFYVNAFFLIPRLLNWRLWWGYILASALLIISSFQLKYHMLVWWFPDVLKDTTAYKFVFAPSIVVFIISIVYRKVLDKMEYDRVQHKIRAEQLSTELKFLRSQISPHFLFNVLTNLVSLARKKSDQIEPALIMLSELMRYSLYDTQAAKVSLGKEIAYLNNYIELQRLRFGDDVEIQYHQDQGSENENHVIEPMLLIPFVENAFKHGTGYLEKPVIQISLSVNHDQLVFEVKNHIDQKPGSSKDENSGIGLTNVRSRLNLLYKDRHQLKIKTDTGIFHIILILMLK